MTTTMPDSRPEHRGPAATATAASAFIRACRGEPVPFTPVWFMRQAGRSLPEYRRVREGVPMLAACRRPDLVCEITLQPVRRHGVDAAILFSDIVVPLAAAGVDLDIVPGVGPVVAEPVRDAAGLARLRTLPPGDVDFVAEAVGLVVRELGTTPLIGFAGAPFTLASYLVEGGPSRSHARTKAMMYGAPDQWHALCARLAEITLTFLRVQVAAGVAAVQLFDSWAGALSEADYRSFVLPHSASVLGGLADAGVPRIHFGVGTGHLLGAMAQAGADVVGVDWRTPLDQAATRIGAGARAVQGNLDPAALLAPWPAVAAQVRRVVAEGLAARGHGHSRHGHGHGHGHGEHKHEDRKHGEHGHGGHGHVFNLGHGVLPETDPGMLTRVVDLVHSTTQGAVGGDSGSAGPGGQA
ncbi:MAG TPA: uroporphyrinogen decarboxylase [Micromonosporaceae bacterium]|nr:uroporphyrinogen decarboxylase [Micromonosporaceae bacterium]